MRRWILRRWILMCAGLVFLVSCASFEEQRKLRNDPEYREGYESGKKTANDDRFTIDCYTPSGAQGLKMTVTRTEAMRKAGNSEAFVTGFYDAYLRQYDRNIDAACD